MNQIISNKLRGAIISALALILMLAIAAFFTSAAGASGEAIPAKRIPRKRIPKQVKYRQAPAYNKQSRKNRRLVIKARKSNRQLRRTGSAYEDN